MAATSGLRDPQLIAFAAPDDVISEHAGVVVAVCDHMEMQPLPGAEGDAVVNPPRPPLPPLRVMTKVRWPRSTPRCSISAPVASGTRSGPLKTVSNVGRSFGSAQPVSAPPGAPSRRVPAGGRGRPGWGSCRWR